MFEFADFLTKANNFPEDEVTNYFVWRQQDAIRNSLSKFARYFFSHKELENKNSSDMHEMLYTKGKNWATDLPDRFKNGVFITREKVFDNCPIFKTDRNEIEKLMVKNYTYSN